LNNIFSCKTVKFLQPYTKVYMGQSLNTVLGAQSPFVQVMPKPIIGQRAPATTDEDYPIGMIWVDEPNDVMYFHLGGGIWQTNNVSINTSTTMAGASNTNVPSSLAIKTYVDNTAIAGAPDASTTIKGLVEIATNAEAVAGTGTGGTGAILAVTPSNLASIFAAAPAIGGTTPAAGSFTTLATSGLATLSASATIETAGTALNLASDASADAVNIGTGAAARTITIGNSTGATSLVLNCGTGSLNIGTNAIAHTVTIGNVTGATAVNINAGSGGSTITTTNSTLALVSGTGALNVGTDAAAKTITIGNGTGATSVVLDCGTGALNIGTNGVAHTITIGNTTGATAIVQSVGTGNFVLNGVGGSTYTIGAATTTGTIAIGGTAQTGTLSIGVSSGIMISNYSTGNGAKTVNVATGIDGNTVNVATGINTSAQTVNISTGASGANSTVNILSGNGSAGTQTANVLTGTRAGALNLATGAAAHVVAVGSASAGAITVDTAANISLDSATASNFTVTGAGQDLTLSSAGGSVLVKSTEDAALAIRLHADAGTSETIQIHSDQGTGVGSVNLLSDVGGITLRATGLASADAINLEAAAGGIDADAALQINIASSQAAASAIVITASDATGGIDLTTGGGSIDLSSSGSVTMVAGTDTQAAASCTVNKNVFAATFTGLTTASAASQVFTVVNSVITTSSQVILTLCNEGANDAQMTITRVKRLAGSIEVTATNNGAAALNGNVTITGWVIG
jgi:hypothetical protein